MRRCPQRPQAILAPQSILSIEQEQDLHVDYDIVFNDVIEGEEARVHFTDTQLLFDSQGGVCVAANSNLVMDVQILSQPYSLGGINGKQERLRVVTGGKISEF
jgi:hypothetical protein